MSEEIKDTESQQDKQVCDENHEETTSQSSTSDYMQIQSSNQGSGTTYEDVASTPGSVLSNDTTDREGLTASECGSDKFFSSNERQEPKRQGEKKSFGLSERIEYLARPKKDYLDEVGYERIDGALPEKALPSWAIIPLPTKLPVASYPYEIATTKLGENVYLPPPGVKMDLQDENDLRPPRKMYHSLHDPYLKAHFEKKKTLKHLMKNGFVSKSGRVICPLEDINVFREYTRRILAERFQQTYRDKQEEQKKEEEGRIKKKDAEEDEKLRNTRAQTSLRAYIKNAVSSIQEGSMETQREKDRKVLNKQIRLQTKWKQSARAKQERYERLFHKHMFDKYEREEEKRLMELEMARLDVEHLEEICRRREKERLDRKAELENFWIRKAYVQIAWVERGMELEKKWFEDREANIARRKAQALAPKRKRKAPKIKETKREDILEGDDKIDDLSIDEILKKEEEEVSSLYEILREQPDEVTGKETAEEEQVEDSRDKFITDSVKTSTKSSDVLIEPDEETITEEIQPQPVQEEESRAGQNVPQHSSEVKNKAVMVVPKTFIRRHSGDPDSKSD